MTVLELEHEHNQRITYIQHKNRTKTQRMELFTRQLINRVYPEVCDKSCTKEQRQDNLNNRVDAILRLNNIVNEQLPVKPIAEKVPKSHT